jgi:cell division protein ZapA (FtsZ GTPase activity inhibitor)
MNNNLQHITLRLDAHTVALNVERDQEAIYREAAQLLNSSYQKYRKLMPQASVEQLWMYVALHIGVNLQSDAREKSFAPMEEKLKEMNNRIEEALTSSSD